MNLPDLAAAIEKIALEAGNYIMTESERFDPSVKEMKGLNDFVTHVDRGAEELIVSKLGNFPSVSLIATGFPYKDFTRLQSYLDCPGYMLKNTTGVRRMGSASIDLAYVACGRFDLFFEYGLNPWDVAAGTLLVREAGGTVSDFSGNQTNITGLEIIAANADVYPEILKIISNFMMK